MKIYLVRHGVDDDTVRGGWSQQPLTKEGQKQAISLAEYISRNAERLTIQKIYSSDLPRAVQTAEPIAESLHLPVVLTPRFREVNNGDLAGMKNDIALEKYPGLFWNQLEWEQNYPNGESPRLFYERVEAAWEELTNTEKENLLLVTHGGVIHVILSIIAGRPYSNTDRHRRIGHAEMIALEWKGELWQERQLP